MDYIKVCVVGEANVGKTCLVRRYTENVYTEGYKATVGVDFAVKGNVTFWDIAGQERFGSMTSVYYRNATGAIVVMDWNNADSMEQSFKWVRDMDEKLNYSVPIVLLVNKSDLPGRYGVEDIDAQCKREENVIGWYLVSAKTGTGVNEAIVALENAMETRLKNKEEDAQTVQLISEPHSSLWPVNSCCS